MPSTYLIFASTINPGRVANSQWNDPEVRRRETLSCLRQWISIAEIDTAIIVENSSDKIFLDQLRTMINDIRPSLEYEMFSFNGQDFNPNKGKGFGYAQSVIKAFEESVILARHAQDKIIITSGRYFMKNTVKILKNYQNGYMCNLQKNLTYAFNPFVIMDYDCLENHFIPYIQQSDESIQGMSFEHQCAKSALSALASGKKWELPCEYYDFGETVSATTSRKYRKSFFHKKMLGLVYQLKVMLFAWNR